MNSCNFLQCVFHVEFSIPISIYDFTTLNVVGSVVIKSFFIVEDIFSDVHLENVPPFTDNAVSILKFSTLSLISNCKAKFNMFNWILSECIQYY